MKKCNKCEKLLPLSEFYPKTNGYKDKMGYSCKKCTAEYNLKHYNEKLKLDPAYKKRVSEYAHDWHLRNQEKNNTRVALNRKRNRLICLNHYGGSCYCCGESRYEFMAIDHIDGGGGAHRREIKSSNIHRWLIKNNFPEGFRALCHNCNQSLGLYGYCPHEKEKAE